jgi:hypothetical protein
VTGQRTARDLQPATCNPAVDLDGRGAQPAAGPPGAGLDIEELARPVSAEATAGFTRVTLADSPVPVPGSRSKPVCGPRSCPGAPARTDCPGCVPVPVEAAFLAVCGSTSLRRPRPAPALWDGAPVPGTTA